MRGGLKSPRSQLVPANICPVQRFLSPAGNLPMLAQAGGHFNSLIWQNGDHQAHGPPFAC